MNKYNLYSSDGCHLCEQALALCLKVIDKKELTVVDIIDNEYVEHELKTLAELYDVHIPVLEKLENNSAKNKKLFWPFTQAQVENLACSI
jgi:hypothetical protein